MDMRSRFRCKAMTKNGTVQAHCHAYDYYRNEALDTVGYFDVLKPFTTNSEGIMTGGAARNSTVTRTILMNSGL